MKTYTLLCLLVCSFLLSSCSESKEARANQLKMEISTLENQKKESLKEVTQKFYDAMSTRPSNGALTDMVGWMNNDWRSEPTLAGGPGLKGFVQTLEMFHGMIPDLKWSVKEMLVDGNRVTVRSVATGTPNSPDGYFFGVPTDGSKSFEVQTIDVHTVENGKLIKSFHVEDWATAIQQVTAMN